MEGGGGSAAVSAATSAAASLEALDWQNRFAELENVAAAAEAERDKLKATLDQSLKQRLDAAEAGDPSAAAAAIEGAPAALEAARREIDALKGQLNEAKSLMDQQLADAVAERDKSDKLSQELGRRLEDLSRLSREKLELTYETRRAAAELQPVKEARDSFEQDKLTVEKSLREAQQELERLREERGVLFCDKAKLQRELQRELEDKASSMLFHQKVSEEARVVQEGLRKKVLAANQKVCEQAEAFAAERAGLEAKLALRDNQLREEADLREATQKRLAEVSHERDTVEEDKKAAAKQTEDLRMQFKELEDELRKTQLEHDKLLRMRIPGVDDKTLPPEGFASLAEMVRELEEARHALTEEKRAKEEVQDVLREVEREVRSRYPALLNQVKDGERLRAVVADLTVQNEGLLVRMKELQQRSKDIDMRKRQAQKSVQILEAHARDMSRQLAVLVHENAKLKGTLALPRGLPMEEALEAERVAFKTTDDLICQNEELRKTIVHLKNEAETKAQQQLEEIREEQDQQVEEWRAHLAEKAEQMKELADTIQRLSRERDEALQDLSSAKQAAAQTASQHPSLPSPGAAALAPSDGSGQQLASAQEEFSKQMKAVNKKAREAEAKEVELRKALATVQARLEFEETRKKAAEEALKLAEKRLTEKTQQLTNTESRVSKLQDDANKEQAAAQEKQEALAALRKQYSQLDSKLKVEQAEHSKTQQSNAGLRSEQAAHLQMVETLKAQASKDAEVYRQARQDMEAAFKREERAFKEQHDLSERRQRDLQRSLEELTSARTSLAEEAQAARGRATAAEATVEKLQAQLEEQGRKMRTLRPDASQSGHVSADDVAAEAEAQLGRSQTRDRDKDPAVQKLELKLQQATERDKEHAASSKLWQALIADHEKELKMRHEQIQGLQNELGVLRAQQAKQQEAEQGIQKREEELQAKAHELRLQTAEVQAASSKKDAEIEAARLERDEHARQAEERMLAMGRAHEADKRTVEDLRQLHRDNITAHAEHIKALEEERQKRTALDAEAKDLRRQLEESQTESQVAQQEVKEDLQQAKRELAREEMHAKALREESSKYKELFLALSEQRGAGDASEAAQTLANEARRVREAGEAQVHGLRIEKEKLTQESRSLKEEVADLQRRLDKEQHDVLKLQAEMGREQRAVAKLGQLRLLEDENRRLLSEARSLEKRLEEARRDKQTQRAEQEPKEARLRELQLKEEEWSQLRSGLESKADEWKRLYDELVVKFDSQDIEMQKVKAMEKERNKAQRQVADLTGKIEKLEGDMRKRAQEAAQTQTLVSRTEDLQKGLVEARMQRDEQATARKKAEEDAARMKSDATRLSGLKQLADKRLLEFEKQIGKLEADNKQLSDQAANAPASGASAVKKADEAAQVAQTRADKALALAMDYQRALESFMAQKREQDKAREASQAAAAAATKTAAADPPTDGAVSGPATSPLTSGGDKTAPQSIFAPSLLSSSMYPMPGGEKRKESPSGAAAEAGSAQGTGERPAKLTRTASAAGTAAAGSTEAVSAAAADAAASEGVVDPAAATTAAGAAGSTGPVVIEDDKSEASPGGSPPVRSGVAK
eukprot:TRINITY_DN13564_c0_g1_i1.p1 TRINITY_DN13564_c0_g1~~TRINITY_DN13564_c0_g1_i1.p1  ORF type:complete len:1586 (+),score=631.31 TRINITY_DN13564_c0_g1_i1:108-4865(+)